MGGKSGFCNDQVEGDPKKMWGHTFAKSKKLSSVLTLFWIADSARWRELPFFRRSASTHLRLGEYRYKRVGESNPSHKPGKLIHIFVGGWGNFEMGGAIKFSNVGPHYHISTFDRGGKKGR